MKDKRLLNEIILDESILVFVLGIKRIDIVPLIINTYSIKKDPKNTYSLFNHVYFCWTLEYHGVPSKQ